MPELVGAAAGRGEYDLVGKNLSFFGRRIAEEWIARCHFRKEPG